MANSSRRNHADSEEQQRNAGAGASLDLWSEQAKHQMECGMETLVALLRGSEEIRKVQLDTAHLALKRHQDLQQRLGEAQDLPQLLGLQAELLRFDAAGAMHYWHELTDAALRMGAEMMRCQVNVLNAGRNDAMKTAIQTVQNGLHTGIRPLDDLLHMQAAQDLVSRPGSRPH